MEWTSIYRNRLKKLYFHGKWQNHFTLKSVSTFIISRIFIWIKIELILPYLMRNHCKEEINSTVSSNILPLYKASSWIWQLSLCENNLESQIYLLVYKLNVCFIRLENLVYWNNLFIIYIVMLYMVFFIWAHKFSTIQ